MMHIIKSIILTQPIAGIHLVEAPSKEDKTRANLNYTWYLYIENQTGNPPQWGDRFLPACLDCAL